MTRRSTRGCCNPCTQHSSCRTSFVAYETYIHWEFRVSFSPEVQLLSSLTCCASISWHTVELMFKYWQFLFICCLSVLDKPMWIAPHLLVRMNLIEWVGICFFEEQTPSNFANTPCILKWCKWEITNCMGIFIMCLALLSSCIFVC